MTNKPKYQISISSANFRGHQAFSGALMLTQVIGGAALNLLTYFFVDSRFLSFLFERASSLAIFSARSEFYANHREDGTVFFFALIVAAVFFVVYQIHGVMRFSKVPRDADNDPALTRSFDKPLYFPILMIAIMICFLLFLPTDDPKYGANKIKGFFLFPFVALTVPVVCLTVSALMIPVTIITLYPLLPGSGEKDAG